MRSKLQQFIHKFFPSYAAIPLIIVVAVNMLCYSGSRLIAAPWAIDVLSPLDKMIPVINGTVWIYLGCYLFWIFNYIRICKESPEISIRFCVSEVVSKLICGLFFVLLPTFRIRPEVLGTGISADLLRLVYTVDAATNLFPSIHCLVSWFCFRGLLWCPSSTKTFRIFSLIAAILVFISTVTTAQHVLLDIVGGVLVAEIGILIADKTGLWKWVYKKAFLRKESPSHG